MSSEEKVESLLRAVIALQVDAREARLGDSETRSEVLLANAGLSNVDIAGIVGKTPANVGMILSRARKAKK
jgi:DNA-directed RNA polymerase specialized sigma24 family protein